MESHQQPVQKKKKKKKLILRSFWWRNENEKKRVWTSGGDLTREFLCWRCESSYLWGLSFSRCIWHIWEMLQRPYHQPPPPPPLRVCACCAHVSMEWRVWKFVFKDRAPQKSCRFRRFAVSYLSTGLRLTEFSAAFSKRTKWIFALGRPSPRLS